MSLALGQGVDIWDRIERLDKQQTYAGAEAKLVFLAPVVGYVCLNYIVLHRAFCV